MKRRLREYLRTSLSTASSRILLLKEYQRFIIKIVEFISEYRKIHEIIAPMFTGATGIYPYIPPLLLWYKIVYCL